MQDVQPLANSKRIVYSFNPSTGHYQKAVNQPETLPTNCLPYELKRETTQAAQIKCHALECLTLREYKKSNGSRKMLTGFEHSNFDGWFIGDHIRGSPKKRIKSLLLIHFANDNSRMDIIIYSGYYKYDARERLRFADMVIPRHVAAIALQLPPQL